MILQTQRLILRELTLDDLTPLHRILSDPVVMAYYPQPFDLKRTQEWIEWNLRNYRDLGHGLWAVIEKKSKRLLGDCGLTLQRVDNTDELEIGYHITQHRWGEGLATEAARACRDYAFDVLKVDRVISWMKPDNIASRRVAEKVGMNVEKSTLSTHGRPAIVYSMTFEHRRPS